MHVKYICNEMISPKEIKVKEMDLHYITDKKGNKSGVQLPMEDWKKIQKDLEELQRLRNKKLFIAELAEAVEEVKQIKKGKLKAQDAEDFLHAI